MRERKTMYKRQVGSICRTPSQCFRKYVITAIYHVTSGTLGHKSHPMIK